MSPIPYATKLILEFMVNPQSVNLVVKHPVKIIFFEDPEACEKRSLTDFTGMFL